MKKILSVIICVLCLASFFTVSADTQIKVFVEDSEIEFSVAPEIENDRTLVQLRPFFASLGAKVIMWDEATSTVHAQAEDGAIFSLQAGTNNLFYENEVLELETSAKIKDGVTMVPVRAIAERLGYSVEWNAKEREIKIVK